jgi:hypothetical protein
VALQLRAPRPLVGFSERFPARFRAVDDAAKACTASWLLLLATIAFSLLTAWTATDDQLVGGADINSKVERFMRK